MNFSREEIDTAARSIVADTAQHRGSFGALRASRRVALSAACRQFAECLLYHGSADEKALTLLQAALADLIELETQIARKNRERFNPPGA